VLTLLLSVPLTLVLLTFVPLTFVRAFLVLRRMLPLV
jgi:hypothetical protein